MRIETTVALQWISMVLGLTQLRMNVPDVVSADQMTVHHMALRRVRTRSTA